MKLLLHPEKQLITEEKKKEETKVVNKTCDKKSN